MRLQFQERGGESQPYPPIHTIDELRMLLHEDIVSLFLTESMARAMQTGINEFMGFDGALKPTEIDEATFSSVYDPNLPTIAVDNDSKFGGAELLGLAALDPPAKANIIFIRNAANHAGLVERADKNSWALVAAAGAIVLPGGQVAYGNFPQPVTVNALETVDAGVLRQCEAAGVKTFHSFEQNEAINDKLRIHEFIGSAPVTPPERIPPEEFLARGSVDSLVIKPTKLSQGTGVLLTGDNADVQLTRQAYAFLADKGYEPIIEERIKSWPIFDSHTGERLDWNVRALISNGEFIDLYFRIGAWGDPVNRSRYARSVAAEDMVAYFKDPRIAQTIIQSITGAAVRIAQEVPTFFSGVDLTYDESSTVRLFELNSGQAGGLQTIAMLTDGYDARLQNTRRMLGNMLALTPEIEPVQEPITQGLILMPSFFSLARSTHEVMLDDHLVDLDPDEISTTDYGSRVGNVLRLAALRDSVVFDLPRAHQIDETLIESYPLELCGFLPRIIGKSPNPARFEPFIDQVSALFPGDIRWVMMRSTISAAQQDLVMYKQHVDTALKKGADMATLESINWTSILRPYDYELSGYPVLERLKMSDFIVNIWSIYCREDYAAAVQQIDQQQPEAFGMGGQLLPELRFMFAVSARQFDDAMAQFAQHAGDNTELAYDFVFNRNYASTSNNAEGLLFYTRFSLQKGIVLEALLLSAAFIRRRPPDDAEARLFAERLAGLLPHNGTRQDRDQLAAIIRSVHDGSKTDGIESPNNHETTAAVTDLAKFNQLLAGLLGNDRATVKQLLADPTYRAVLGNDYEFYQELIENP